MNNWFFNFVIIFQLQNFIVSCFTITPFNWVLKFCYDILLKTLVKLSDSGWGLYPPLLLTMKKKIPKKSWLNWEVTRFIPLLLFTYSRRSMLHLKDIETHQSNICYYSTFWFVSIVECFISEIWQRSHIQLKLQLTWTCSKIWMAYLYLIFSTVFRVIRFEVILSNYRALDSFLYTSYVLERTRNQLFFHKLWTLIWDLKNSKTD